MLFTFVCYLLKPCQQTSIAYLKHSVWDICFHSKIFLWSTIGNSTRPSTPFRRRSVGCMHNTEVGGVKYRARPELSLLKHNETHGAQATTHNCRCRLQVSNKGAHYDCLVYSYWRIFQSLLLEPLLAQLNRSLEKRSVCSTVFQNVPRGHLLETVQKESCLFICRFLVVFSPRIRPSSPCTKS